MCVILSQVNFHGALKSAEHQVEKQDIARELAEIAQQLYSSLTGGWEVNVWLASESSADWVPAGIHKYCMKGGDNDAEHAVASLAISWGSMLSCSGLKTPLALTISRPGMFKIEEEQQAETPSPKEAQVAKPETEPLKGEWVPVNPRYTRKQWIVSDNIMQSFDDAVSIIRNSDKIYKEWGFEEVDPNPRAVLCFYGPAGTGKTMAAHVLASELGRKIVLAKYSQIESKYVGEAPKNLMRIFEIAKATDSVLFFDEADSFLGKRIENVTQGAEQAINSLRGEMLILLEEFRGVVVFATNLLPNIDRAFESRIISKIEFEMPNAAARREMIRSKIPSKAPLEAGFGERELDKLVELSEGFSGRVIRSAMMMSFVKAARYAETSGENVVRFVDFEQAFIEQKETAEKIEQQYSGANGNAEIQIPEEAQKPLLDIAAEAISSGDCEKVKLN